MLDPNIPQTQACSTCREVKRLDQFHRNSKSKLGVAYKCKQCVKAYNTARYAANREKLLAWQKEYHDTHREEARVRNKAYSEKNRDYLLSYYRQRRAHNKKFINAKQRADYAANIDKKRQQRRESDERNPERAAENHHRSYLKHRGRYLERQKAYGRTGKGRDVNRQGYNARRARLRGATVTPVRPLSQMIQEQRHKCYLCGRRFTKIDPPELEHYVPLAKGGDHSDANTMAAHRSCNSRKHALEPQAYAKRIGKLLI